MKVQTESSRNSREMYSWEYKTIGKMFAVTALGIGLIAGICGDEDTTRILAKGIYNAPKQIYQDTRQAVSSVTKEAKKDLIFLLTGDEFSAK